MRSAPVPAPARRWPSQPSNGWPSARRPVSGIGAKGSSCASRAASATAVGPSTGPVVGVAVGLAVAAAVCRPSNAVIDWPFKAGACKPKAAAKAALAPSNWPLMSAQATGTSSKWKAATSGASGAKDGGAGSRCGEFMQGEAGWLRPHGLPRRQSLTVLRR